MKSRGFSGDIHLGDVLLACNFLRDDGESVESDLKAEVLDLLGFEWNASRGDLAEPRDYAESRPAPEEEAASQDSIEKSVGGENEAFVTVEKAAEVDVPEWYSDALPLPSTGSALGLPDYPSIPLLNPSFARSVIIAVLGCDDGPGEIDIEAVVEELALNLYLSRIPRQRRRKLSRHVRVLVDTHEAMHPFAHDQEEIVSVISQLVPSESFEAEKIYGCPEWEEEILEDSGAWAESILSRHSLVLLLTDLGLSPSAPGAPIVSIADWVKYIRRLRSSGCQVAALVPSSSFRVPDQIRSVATIVPWCRETTSAQVRRLQDRIS